MRLFIALDLEELKPYFKELQKQIPAEPIAKLKPVSAFHLTLKFLGEVEKEQLDGLKQALSEVKFKPLKLTLDNIGVFPAESYIRVVWVGIKENKDLMQLEKDILSTLHKFHMREDFKFMPHLTLTRVKFINNQEEFLKSLKKIKPESKTIEIKEFKLIKSELTEKGPKYKDLKEFS